MHCNNCNYSLWNLTTPRCPECGRGFDVRDWQFESGSVKFGCPNCEFVFKEEKQDISWGVCESCKHKFRWSDVRVIPQTDNADKQAIRRANRTD